MSTINLFEYEISNRGLQGDVKEALRIIESGEYGRYLACANPHSMVIAGQDLKFNLALKSADLLVPDGIGVVLAAKILRQPLYGKVAGNDFFVSLSEKVAAMGNLRYFFLGSNHKVLKKIADRLAVEYPAINLCGTYSPPYKAKFSKEENDQMLAAVNAARPDVLWVGMTAPKQEKWIYQNRHRLEVPFIAAVGAVFDFYAGTIHRSTDFWIDLGLEWLPRFLKEPRRLWRRNLVSTPVFIWWVLKACMVQSK